MIRAASLALALALAALPATGAAQKVTSVARGADGSMVLVRFDSDLQTPPPAAAFRLLDVTGGTDVPLGSPLEIRGPCADRANRLLPLQRGTTDQGFGVSAKSISLNSLAFSCIPASASSSLAA